MTADGADVLLDFSRERPSGTLYAHQHPLLLVASLRLLMHLKACIATDSGVEVPKPITRQWLRLIPLPEARLERHAEAVGLLSPTYDLHELPSRSAGDDSVFF